MRAAPDKERPSRRGGEGPQDNTVNPAWTVEPGYEPVRDAFVKGMGSFGFGGGAYCAYVGGRPVIDLWGGEARAGEAWQADTGVLMSATKSLGSMCLQLLVDRDQIDLDEKVATYWPEYGQNGKGARPFASCSCTPAASLGSTRCTRYCVTTAPDGATWT